MNQSKAYEIIRKEYLSKCKESGCDGCIAEIYCIMNNLRTDRYPQPDCSEKLKDYLKQLR
jgi:hypothetical protein